MSTNTKNSEHLIDASGKVLGRVAAEAAHVLNGKNSTDFAKNKIFDVDVKIINAGKLKIAEKKTLQKKYAHYSGYPGGLRFETLAKVIVSRGKSEALRRAVRGMLPSNKLRSIRMKNLTITE